MKITFNNTKPVNFGYNYGDFDGTNGKRYKVLTDFMRADTKWEEIVDRFEKTFPEDEKVNFYVLGSSSGEEVFSYIMRLKTVLGDKFQKYMKIKGIDFNKENIRKAKTQRLPMTRHELLKTQKYTNQNLGEFMDIKIFNDYLVFAKPKPILRDNAEFIHADILDKIDDIQGERLLISAKNFWPYLTLEQQRILLNKIAEKCKDTQHLLHIGKTDTKPIDGISYLLEGLGFKETTTDNVYQIPSKKYYTVDM